MRLLFFFQTSVLPSVQGLPERTEDRTGGDGVCWGFFFGGGVKINLWPDLLRRAT